MQLFFHEINRPKGIKDKYPDDVALIRRRGIQDQCLDEGNTNPIMQITEMFLSKVNSFVYINHLKFLTVSNIKSKVCDVKIGKIFCTGCNEFFTFISARD